MQGWSPDRAPKIRSRSVEDLLDAAEARARARLVRRLADVGDEIGGALPGADAIRRHPLFSTAFAAALGAIAAPILVRALGGPLAALRRGGSLLTLLRRTSGLRSSLASMQRRNP
jgi:hypothetical protein